MWKIDDTLLPVVELGIRQGGGEIRNIPALVDTGNDCELVMSRSRMSDVGLSFDDNETVGVRGVHGRAQLPTCRAEAIWDDEPKDVLIIEGNVPTLVGKGLLEDYSVYIEMRDGGAIILQRLPQGDAGEQP